MPEDIALQVQMPTDLRSRDKLGAFQLNNVSEESRGIASLTVNIPSSHRSRGPGESRPPPRWRTTEFLVYYLLAIIVLPWMIWVPISLSTSSHVNYPFYHSRLYPGWLFGRELDNSDSQYRSFRNNIPALSILAAFFLTLKFIYTKSALRSLPEPPSHRLYLIPFFVIFSVLMLSILHGASIIKIFVILTMNYAIGSSCKGSKLGPLLTWVFNGAVLFANEKNSGYRFSSLHPSLEILDFIQGVYPRWHVSFNITMLRLVSFNMDYYWACNRVSEEDSGAYLTEKQRSNIAHPIDIYSYQNYVAYVLYSPLYIAGPIMTFNNFMWQLRRPIDIPGRTIIRYLVRFVISLLTMEFILHFMHVVAIKDAKAWPGDTPFELSMIGFWNLMIMWLKLLLPWRFFRLWSLASGIDPPENMVRCMVNNYSTLGFWRSWHRSYNLWIIRYIYIPLGGTKNATVTTVLIFSFVALWHDLSFKLLAWGWLVSLFILPELFASFLFPASKYGQNWWYRHVCVAGGVLNILMMVSANLVGFVIGTDGMLYMVKKIFGSLEGLRFLVGASCCIFVGIQLMFEYREEEMRRGIYRRC